MMHKTCNGDSLRCGKLSAMKLDTLQGVKCVGGYVALAAVGAGKDRHVLDDEKRRSTSVTTGHMTQANSGFPANRALRSFHRGIRIRRHKRSQSQASQLARTSRGQQRPWRHRHFGLGSSISVLSIVDPSAPIDRAGQEGIFHVVNCKTILLHLLFGVKCRHVAA